jgi:hypothetical protein
MTDRFDVVLTDLRDLRAEVREGFHRLDLRLDESIIKCERDCVRRFVGKGDFATMAKWVKGTTVVGAVLMAAFLLTHGEQAVAAVERVIKWM